MVMLSTSGIQEAKNVVLENAGSLTVVTGSRAVDTIINANGKMDVYGKDVGTVLNSAGTQNNICQCHF
ncbi:AIDA repeat-containing protein [Escherichia coli]